jgi:hypothetical protein
LTKILVTNVGTQNVAPSIFATVLSVMLLVSFGNIWRIK